MKLLKYNLVFIFLFCLNFSAHAEDELKVLFAGQQTIDGTNAVAVIFSSPLDPRQNLETYFSIYDKNNEAVDGGWILAKDTNRAYFRNIGSNRTYIIKINKGLKSEKGEHLEKDLEFRVKTRPVEPSINFASKGFILTSTLNQGLPVNTLNIDQVDIDFFRVKPSFYYEFTRMFRHRNRLDYYRSKRLRQNADLVYTGRWELDIKKDLRTPVNIPVTHIKQLKIPGIYIAVLRGAGHYDYSYSMTWFSISDIGLHIKTYKNEIKLFAQSLKSAKPLRDVSIDGFNEKGLKTKTVQTDLDGIARINGNIDHIKYLVARKGGHITFVSMDMPVVDLSEFKSFTEPFRPVDFFVYGPRDLYRPGETVVLDGLVRNHDGRRTSVLPVQTRIFRPDGRMVNEFAWKGNSTNYYHYEYRLPSDAMTGTWRVQFKQSGSKFKEYEFIVAEFLPERMKLILENPDKENTLLIQDSPVIALSGDYLYGAPAVGNKVDAKVTVRPVRELFKKKWPGYEFGNISEKWDQYFQTDPVFLNEQGKGRIKLKNEWKEAASPLFITANVNLYDSGGRPVVRTQSWQVWPDNSLIGIRLINENDIVAANSMAQFEIIRVNRSGDKITAKELDAVVIREYRDYYWEFRHGRWQWRFTSQSYPVDRFTIDISDERSAIVNVPVKWGGYRLEIKDPETGLISNRRFWAGWHPDSISARGGANRPDRVDLVMDKPAYRINDIAKVSLKSPEGGSGYVFVESDTNLLTIPVTVPVEGKTIEFNIDPSWDRHDLYVSALIVRKGDPSFSGKAGRLPKRAVGLTPLRLERSERNLDISIQSPDKTEPNQRVNVTVNVIHEDKSVPENGWVTIAAVDTGILNLTGFKTPSPHDYFFQQRSYAVKMNDIYQKLIEANEGTWSSMRFGGDAPNLTRGGDRPSTDVQILSIARKAVKLDENGNASFNLDLPDFNGQVRLMAVAHTAEQFGSADKEMTLASPMVTQITMPRFLSMGDRANLIIDAHNLSGSLQELRLNLSTSGPVKLTGKGSEWIRLEKGERKEIIFPVLAQQQLGKTRIQLHVDGLMVNGEKKRVDREWFLDIRPPYPALANIFRKRLEPQEVFRLGAKEMGPFIKDTLGVEAILSPFPPINILSHVKALGAYPYGCLEQTTSGIFPHVILSSNDFETLGISSDKAETVSEKIKIGIQRLMEKQKSNGGFGLWSATADESYWLTCYTVDFLLHARQAGYEVPQSVLKKALDRLKTYIRRPRTINMPSYYSPKEYRAAVRAYAAFVLARVQGLTLGDARALYKDIEKDITGSLVYVHAGLAFILSGDEKKGVEILNKAENADRYTRGYSGDYGSNLRDFAIAYFLISTYYPEFRAASDFIFRLHDELNRKPWLSTQERNALVLAGSIGLKTKGKNYIAQVIANGQSQDISHTGLRQVVMLNGKAADGFEIKNVGNEDIFYSVTLSGYPEQKPIPVSHSAFIQRRYLTMKGEPLDMSGRLNFNSGDRLLVELSFSADQRMPDCLIVDLLPAGLELEDPSLAGSMDIGKIEVNGKSVNQWHQLYDIRHTEYRDDRFVAALDIDISENYKLFYAVRVVSPGSFLIPPPLMEDMYRPHIRSIGDTKPLMTITNP